MTNTAIQIKNLSKRYRIGTKQEVHDTFVEAVGDWLMRPIKNYRQLRQLTNFDDENNANQEDVIWALRDITFEVESGEVIGIIGRNGAGKSTLLKILSRITHPTSGSVVLNGRVSSLLEVGTGFHPELTGRENVYLNGTILGMTKAEVDEKFEEIVDFSGVRKFIDTPVKFFSSGMAVRLAFSIAAHLEPEILLVDEVLAVGDAEFQNKCLGKMEDVARYGRTVLFVSHNMRAISRLCQRGIWLEEGRIAEVGPVDQVIQSYLFSGVTEHKPMVEFSPQDGVEGQILTVKALDLMGNPSLVHLCKNPFSLQIRYRLNEEMKNYRLGVKLRTPDGYEVLTRTNSDLDNTLWTDSPGEYSLLVDIPGQLIKPGKYLVTVFLGQPGIKQHDKHENVLALRLDGQTYSGQGLIIRPLEWQKEKL
jgi:lipopolysaccharide transport system ATP-binding protein